LKSDIFLQVNIAWFDILVRNAIINADKCCMISSELKVKLFSWTQRVL